MRPVPKRRSGTLALRGGRPSARSRARPLTACCGRYNEASDGAVGSTDDASITMDLEGRGNSHRFATDLKGRSEPKQAAADAVVTNAALSAPSSQQASDDVADGPRGVRGGMVFRANTSGPQTSAAQSLRMFKEAMAIRLPRTRWRGPVVILAFVIAVTASGHTVGSDKADNLDPFRRSGTLAGGGGRLARGQGLVP